MKFVAAAILLALLAMRSFAATPPPDSTHVNLSAALMKAQTGQMIRIKTGAGLLEGKFQGMAPAGVRVTNPRVSPAPIVILADSVKTVEKERGHALRGSLIGLTAGFGVGYLIGSAAHSSNSVFTQSEAAVVVGVGFGTLGGILGTVMGHSYKTWDVIYP
jgi:hypothetical protein